MSFEGVRTIGQIHVSVSDIDRSVAFYRDVLGIRFLFDVPGRSMAFFDVGGVRLYLGRPETPDFRSTPILYFSVDDVDEAYEALRDAVSGSRTSRTSSTAPNRRSFGWRSSPIRTGRTLRSWRSVRSRPRGVDLGRPRPPTALARVSRERR